MSGNGSAQGPQRLFVALDLPMAIEQGIGAWARARLSTAGWRPTSPNAMHLTLCFLGACDPARAERVCALVEGLPADPLALGFKPAAVGRPRRDPRVIALEVESDDAVRLQARLAAELAAAEVAPPVLRRFWPHVTVARRQPGSAPAPIGKPSLPTALLDRFDGVRVSVYRSDLRPSGAEYVALARKDLPPKA